MAYLTDLEKRLLFAALAREKKICKQIDDSKVDDGTCKMLVPVIESLEKKFHYDRFEQDIYIKGYREGQDKLFENIEKHSYTVAHGINNIEKGMTLTGMKQCIDEPVKDEVKGKPMTMPQLQMMNAHPDKEDRKVWFRLPSMSNTIYTGTIMDVSEEGVDITITKIGDRKIENSPLITVQPGEIFATKDDLIEAFTDGLREISFDQVGRMWEAGEIGRVLYTYPDGTESYIDENDARWAKIVKHRDNGGGFAIEGGHAENLMEDKEEPEDIEKMENAL